MAQDAPAGTPSDMVIERGKVHEFARAATSTNPASVQEETPIAPAIYRATVAGVHQRNGHGLVDLDTTVTRHTGGVYLHLPGWDAFVLS
jgi:hypothetical protein